MKQHEAEQTVVTSPMKFLTWHTIVWASKCLHLLNSHEMVSGGEVDNA